MTLLAKVLFANANQIAFFCMGEDYQPKVKILLNLLTIVLQMYGECNNFTGIEDA